MEHQRAAELIAQALRCEYEEEEYRFKFTLSERLNSLELGLEKSVLADIVSDLDAKTVSDSLSLHDETTLEILVREESQSPIRRMRDDRNLDIRDDDNGISYTIGEASDTYILFFLDLISQHQDFRYFLRGAPSQILLRQIERLGDDATVFNILRVGFLRIETLKVTCDSKTSLAKLSRFANAFLFQMAYNTDVALVPQRELDVLARTSRINRMRRNQPSEIDPPRRIYNDDLTHHYLLAVSTDNPVVEYLSHYHVLEHFYEAVFNDDLIAQIQSQLTSPSFSYRRKRDVKGLVSSVQKSLKIRNDTITFSEEHALRLTLAKFVNPSDLASDLTSYDPSTLDYYRDNKVPFSGGVEVDLSSGESETILKQLAKRIYQTRNALVHSKDGDKAKYTPFVDDHALSRELPLLRFIAERTVILDSSLIE